MRVSSFLAKIKVNDGKYVLLNSRTGAVDIVDADVADFLSKLEEGQTVKSIDSKLIDMLKISECLTDKSSEEEKREATDFCKRLYERISVTKSHIILLTYDCNLRCQYCWESALKKRGPEWIEKSLDESKVMKIFDAIRYFDCHSNKKNPIVLFGGEPFLPRNVEVVEQIFKIGSDYGYPFFVVTNGVTLGSYLGLLKKIDVKGLQITLDGPREVHDKRRFKADGTGTFDEIVQNIEQARKIGLPLFIRVMVDPKNEKDIRKFANFLQANGWHEDRFVRAYLAPVFPHSGSSYCYANPREASITSLLSLVENPSVANVFERNLKYFHPLEEVFYGTGDWFPLYYYCNAHYSQFFYDPHGDIYPCWLTLGEKRLAIGRYSPKLKMNKNFKSWQSRNVFNLPRCKNCRYALLCGGGCAYSVFEQKGTIMDSDCRFFSAIHKYYIPYLYSRMKRQERGCEPVKGGT